MKNKKSSGTRKSFRDYLIYFPRIIFSFFILLIVIICPLIIISGSASFYKNNLDENCFNVIGEKDCRELQMNVMNFLKGKEVLDKRYDAQEKSHFEDVKKIIDFAKALTFALTVFVFMYFAVIYFFDKKEIFEVLKLSGILSVLFVFVLLLFVIFSFSGTFFIFHELLFPQGNWTFPFDSTIITIFPEQFFVHAAFISMLSSLGVGLILWGFGKRYCKQK